MRQSHALSEYAINTRVGSAAPIKPLDSVARAINVQQRSIQPRVLAVVLLCWARSSAHKAEAKNADKAMSKEFT